MVRLLLLVGMAGLIVYMFVRLRGESQRRKEVLAELQGQVGKRGVVTESCGRHGGVVRINGAGYAACSEGEAIAPRVLVEVVEVERFRLLVRKVQGMGQLVDVDDLRDRGEPGTE